MIPNELETQQMEAFKASQKLQLTDRRDEAESTIEEMREKLYASGVKGLESNSTAILGRVEDLENRQVVIEEPLLGLSASDD